MAGPEPDAGTAGHVRIRRTDDLDAVRALGLANGLDDSERANEQVRAAWGAYDGDRLVGGVALELDGGYDLVSWMAVDAPYRHRGIARRLLRELESEARRLGIRRLWAQARDPGFFRAAGYASAPPADARRLLAGCAACKQFGHGCEPQALTKVVGGGVG